MSKEQEMAASAEAWLRGKLPNEEVDKAVNALRSQKAADKISMGGSVICAIFYWRIHLEGHGHYYNGNAGGIGGFGAASTNGDIYTDDINRLYAEAYSFQFNSAAVYLNVNFFNRNSQFLGHYHGGGVGTCIGSGGGTGSWGP